jgi:Tfp pilus assembly protein PilE
MALTPAQQLAAQDQFLKWLKAKDPFLYSVADKAYRIQIENAKRSQGLASLTSLAFNVGDFFKSALNTVTTLAPKVIEYNQQKKLLDAQIERAKQGLAPLNVAEYSVTVPYNPSAPTAQQQQMVNQLAYEAANKPATPSWVLPLGLGAAALFLFKMFKG